MKPTRKSIEVCLKASGALLFLLLGLIGSTAVYSDDFVSSLVVLNMDTEPNDVLVFATGSGESIGSLTIALGVGQRIPAYCSSSVHRQVRLLKFISAPSTTSCFQPCLRFRADGELLDSSPQ